MEGENTKSEQRRRNHRSTIRMTAEEDARVRQLAAEKGLSVGAYLRHAALGDKGPRAQSRPKPKQKAMAAATVRLQQLSAEHNRIGSNLNQIARAANAAGFETVASGDLAEAVAQYEKAVDELGAMRAAMLAALGYDDH